MYYPHFKTGIRYTFTLQCPNRDNKLTLSLLNDATVQGNIHYYDVCKVADSVTIAYNNEYWVFEVDPETQTMVEYPQRPVKGWHSSIPRNWEIIKSFIDHYSLIPTWIDCDYTFGILDEETGTWTGAVGKVKNCFFLDIFIQMVFRFRGMRQTGQCLDLPAPIE